jgi:hypothetical protein
MPKFLLVLGTALVFAWTANAQIFVPTVRNLVSSGVASAHADDAGGAQSQGFDLATYLFSVSDAGHLSSPPGSASTIQYQDCSGGAALDASVAGPAAPFIQTSADMMGTQNGSIFVSSFPCTAVGTGGFLFDFAFFSATFDANGGHGLPIVFHIDGSVDASGTCSTAGAYCNLPSQAFIELEQTTQSQPITLALVSANKGGPTSDVLNLDVTGDMLNTFILTAGASSEEGGFELALGQTGGGSSTAEVNGLQIMVNFGATEAAMKLADPGLAQATIDAGLADLEVLVSPGVDLSSFAPQFPQVPAPTLVPALSRAGFAILMLLLVAAAWSYGPLRRHTS